MVKLSPAIVAILGLVAISPFIANAADVQSIAEKEVVRHQHDVDLAKHALAEGDKAYSDKHYDVAVVEYQSACDYLPEAPITHELRGRAIQGFSQASVRLAEQRIVEGRFADAEATVNTLLAEKYNPTYKPALLLRAHLEDPDYYNKTVGPKFYDKVEEVKRLFTEAQGFYDSGRFDLAYKRYDQILGLDPYNIAARKGQEEVNAARLKYADVSYDTTRSYLNWKVEQGWDLPPRKYVGHEIVRIDSGATNVRSTEYIQNKLNHIIIPKIEFREATVREAVAFLHQKSVELDTTESDPARKGVNIVLKLEGLSGGGLPPAAAPGAGLPPDPNAVAGVPAAAPASVVSPADQKITLSLTNIPLAEALRYITSLAGLKVKIDPYAVTIVPLSEPTDTLVTKEYKVPPGFLNTNGAEGGGTALSAPAAGVGGGAAGGGAVGSPQAPSSIPHRVTAFDFLKAAGVDFPPGASANFLAASSKLVVRNTEANLDLVDQIVEASFSVQPVQVNIEAKFVEIQQTNFKELSFDYQLGTGLIGRLQYMGGNTTNPATSFPFGAVAGGEIGTGLRSGNDAISGDSIDALLAGTTAGPSPNTFAIAGVVTSAQFQMVMRALNQKKGVDLLSAPSVTTKSGQRAVIEIVREFRYPTEFDPPHVPNINGGAGGAVVNFVPVTPTTPTAFETRNTGVTLEVEPVVGADGETIDLNLAPQVVEFDGFVNYGSPIYGPVPTNIFGIPIGPATLLTANTINQPIFDTRKVTTSVSVWDGQTVVIGGLIREDVQTVNDKIPGLGDLPIVGRLFRSQVDQHIKRNLVMFVSAHLMNPAGDLVHEDEEKEEEVAPLTPPDLVPPPSLPDVPLPK